MVPLLLLLLLGCSCVVSGLQDDDLSSSQQKVPRILETDELNFRSDGDKAIDDNPLHTIPTIYRVKELPINCNLGKVKMEEFSIGCQDCTCKKESVTCVKNILSCEFDNECYQNQDTWTHGNKSCICRIGHVMCLPIFPRRQEEPPGYKDDSLARITTAGYIPLNFTFTSPLLELEWQTPIKTVLLYELHITKKKAEAIELIEATRRTSSSKMLYDFYQQVVYVTSASRKRGKRGTEHSMMPTHTDWKRSWKKKTFSNKENPHPYLVISQNTSYWTRGGCFSKYVAEWKQSDLKMTYTRNRTSRVSMDIMPCLDETYYVVLVAHLQDSCPDWEPDNCQDQLDLCYTDSDCLYDMGCCSISDCGRRCVQPDPNDRTKKYTSRVMVFDLSDMSGRSFFPTSAGSNALTPLGFVIFMLILFIFVKYI